MNKFKVGDWVEIDKNSAFNEGLMEDYFNLEVENILATANEFEIVIEKEYIK